MKHYQCLRCHESFRNQEELEEHSNSLQSCSPRQPAETRMFSRDEERLLRKRSTRGMSEEEKWRELYRILFPSDESIQSPCESPIEAPLQVTHTTGHETTQCVRSFMRSISLVLPFTFMNFSDPHPETPKHRECVQKGLSEALIGALSKSVMPQSGRPVISEDAMAQTMYIVERTCNDFLAQLFRGNIQPDSMMNVSTASTIPEQHLSNVSPKASGATEAVRISKKRCRQQDWGTENEEAIHTIATVPGMQPIPGRTGLTSDDHSMEEGGPLQQLQVLHSWQNGWDVADIPVDGDLLLPIDAQMTFRADVSSEEISMLPQPWHGDTAQIDFSGGAWMELLGNTQ